MNEVRMRGLFLVLAGIALVAGCGKKEEPGPPEVRGTITLADGRPLPGGWIAFHGKDAFEVSMAPIDNGKFIVYGAPAGSEVRVTIDVNRITAQAQDLDLRLHDALTRADLVKRTGKTDLELNRRIATLKERKAKLERLQRALKEVRVDSRYLQKEMTPLSYAVHGGQQTIDIGLQP